MKISFDKINLNFENVFFNDNDERLRRVSRLVFSLLDEKLSNTFGSDTVIKSANKISFDQIIIPNVSVDPDMSDYEIAYRCASAIYQAILDKLR
jgi:hypothetical protein